MSSVGYVGVRVMLKYGWYSEKSMLRGGLLYIYESKSGSEVLCTGVSSSRECPYKYDDIRYVGELRRWIRNEKIGDLGVARGGGMSAIKSIKNM